MLKRIFRLILIINLTFSLTLVSIANSVNVSDGSAFVTKSELAYQLNTISIRMSQLENSLDSKIDQLVSSYLTRNGIWNGSEVNINKNETKLYGSDFIREWDGYDVKQKTVWSETTTADKTGMMITSIHIEGKQNGYTSYRCYLRIRGGYWAGFEDDARVMLGMAEIINGVDNVRSNIEIANSQLRITYNPGNSSAGYAQQNGTHILPLPINNNYVLLGFVSKGNQIVFSMVHNVSDFQQHGSSFDTPGINGDAYLSMQIIDSKIY